MTSSQRNLNLKRNQNTNNHPVFPHQRIGIFIDAQNIYHSAKHLYRSRVNFSELVKFLTGNRTLARAIAYVAKSDPITGEDSFFDALRKSGFELRIKDLQIFSDGSKKADWDVGIAVDTIRAANSLDVIILVTGDGDFIPLVEYLQVGLGKRVEVAGFSKTTSGHLKEVVDRVIELEDIPKILLPIGGQKKNIKRRNKK